MCSDVRWGTMELKLLKVKEAIQDVRSCHQGIMMGWLGKEQEDIMEMIGFFDVKGRN